MEVQCANIETNARRYDDDASASFRGIESGKRNDRPELIKALVFCRQKKAILEVVSKPPPGLPQRGRRSVIPLLWEGLGEGKLGFETSSNYYKAGGALWVDWSGYILNHRGSTY